MIPQRDINQGTQMTRQVKPQASILMSTHKQEAFESLIIHYPESEAGNAEYAAKVDTRNIII